MMTARTALATRAATRCWYPNCPWMLPLVLPRFGFLEFTFWQTHQFCRYRNERARSISLLTPASATSVCPILLLLLLHWLGNIRWPLFSAELRGLGSYPWLSLFPAPSLSLSLCSFLSLSLSVSLCCSVSFCLPLCLRGQLVTGFLCVEGSFVVFDLFVCLRSLDPINYVVSLAGAISLSPSSPSLSVSLSWFVCAAIWGLSAVGNRADCLS